MRPEDVPTELAVTLGEALYDDAHENCGEDGCYGGDRASYIKQARWFLADLLPAHEAMVLEKVACQPPGVAVLTEEDLAARDAEVEQRVRAKVAEETPRAAEMLAEFHAAAGDKPGKGLPGIAPTPERTIRRELLAEEYHEYLVAEVDEDRVAIADALADMAYVIYGTAYTYGIPLDAVLAEVHRSNMTKDFSTEPGKKIRKGANYSPPDIAAVLARGERP